MSQQTATDRPVSGGLVDRIILRGGIVVTMDPEVGEALRGSGRRTMFAFSCRWGDDPRHEFPGSAAGAARGLARLRAQYFSTSGMKFFDAGNLREDTWRAMSDAGVHISISPAIEMQVGLGTPPGPTAPDHGMLPSLSSDDETNLASDMFTQMRAAYTLQCTKIFERIHSGDDPVPSC